MSDTTTTKSVLSFVTTTSSKIRELIIKNGQLIFLKDLGRIAFDYDNKRVFYNQIVELETEVERLSLNDPISGYYFVLESAILWFYKDTWIQITEKPQEVLFVGEDVDFPQVGQTNKIYASTTDKNEHISIWDDKLGKYVVVADKTQEVSDVDIEGLFKQKIKN